MQERIQLKDEQELIQRTLANARASGKKNFFIFAGHFPLFYKEGEAYAAINAWGAFTPYAMDLGCKIGKELLNDGEVKFAIIADDVNYDSFEENSQFNHSRKRGMRNRFYKAHSGPNATLPKELNAILYSNNFTTANIIRQDQGKHDRHDCLIFSEKVLRAAGTPAKNHCARSYREFISNPIYFNTERDYLISFIPDRCMGNICNGVLEDLGTIISASHIFMQTDSTLVHMTDKKGIWSDWGVYYRKD